MRVTHVITRLIVGGAQENTVATVLGLRSKAGITVELISGPTTGPEGSVESSFAGFPQLLRIVPSLIRPVRPWSDLLAFLDLRRILRESRPDIVHTHSGKAGILGRLAARAAGVPIIIHHIHGPSFGAFQGSLPNAVFKSAERYTGKFTTHFISSANAMNKLYLSAGIGRPERYTRIFSGFPVESFVAARDDPALRAALGLPIDAFVIGKIARLFPLKGHEDLFLAMGIVLAECPQARLLLVGGGPLRARLESQAHSLGLAQKVVFTGLVPPQEVPRYIGVMDCVAHLSDREGLPRALPQALAAGKPVVAYDLFGANEVCLDGETGFLVKPGDTESVARHLLHLSGNVELRKQLGLRGQRFVQERFTIGRMVNDCYELYLRLCRGETGACRKPGS